MGRTLRPTSTSRVTDGPRAAGADPGVLADSLGYALRRAQVAAFQQFMEAMGEFGVTPGQFGVLALVDANPGLTQTELGHAIGVDRSTVVAVLDRLEERRLVARVPSPSDRRSHVLVLGEQGKGAFAEILRRHDAFERRLARRLTREERRTLVALLRRVAAD
jgi:DNA-binding MarR family transcriptional regulator